MLKVFLRVTDCSLPFLVCISKLEAKLVIDTPTFPHLLPLVNPHCILTGQSSLNFQSGPSLLPRFIDTRFNPASPSGPRAGFLHKLVSYWSIPDILNRYTSYRFIIHEILRKYDVSYLRLSLLIIDIINTRTIYWCLFLLEELSCAISSTHRVHYVRERYELYHPDSLRV